MNPYFEIATEAAHVSDRLNNLLCGIALQAGLLADRSEGSHRDQLVKIVDLCVAASDYTKMLREIAEKHLT